MSFQVNPNQSQVDHFRPCQMVSEYVAHDVAGVNDGAKGIEICEEFQMQKSSNRFSVSVAGRGKRGHV